MPTRVATEANRLRGRKMPLRDILLVEISHEWQADSNVLPAHKRSFGEFGGFRYVLRGFEMLKSPLFFS